MCAYLVREDNLPQYKRTVLPSKIPEYLHPLLEPPYCRNYIFRCQWLVFGYLQAHMRQLVRMVLLGQRNKKGRLKSVERHDDWN